MIVTEKNIGFRLGSETRGQSTTANSEKKATQAGKRQDSGAERKQTDA